MTIHAFFSVFLQFDRYPLGYGNVSFIDSQRTHCLNNRLIKKKKKEKYPRYIFLHSNVSKPTENIQSLAFCLSILAHLLQFLIQQIY